MSAQGRRLINQWVKQPLTDLHKINERLNLVEALQVSQPCRNASMCFNILHIRNTALHMWWGGGQAALVCSAARTMHPPRVPSLPSTCGRSQRNQDNAPYQVTLRFLKDGAALGLALVLQDHELREAVQTFLKGMADLHTIARKFQRSKADLKDVLSVYNVILRLPEVFSALTTSDCEHPELVHQALASPVEEAMKDLENFQKLVSREGPHPPILHTHTHARAHILTLFLSLSHTHVVYIS